jgi:predicted AlkP superfamily phosphohydrolase/phosphomutase
VENSSHSNKILVIGLDAATFDLIKPWIGEGKLPTFDFLLKHGSYGNLKSVPNTNSAPAWTSFVTGHNPGKHGIFYFDEPIQGTYNRRYINGSYRKTKALWNYFSDAGKKVGVINVPLTYPAEEVNGFMIAGLDTPGLGSKGFTYPESLARDLKSRLGNYIIEPGIPGLIKAGKKELAVKRLLATIEKRHAYAEFLMEHNPWDLFIVVFTAIDLAQHFFWKDMDPSHPQHDVQEASAYGDTILRVYQKIDQTIASLLKKSKNATIILLSDHGGGFNQRGAEFINPWLAEIGLLKYKNTNVKKHVISGLESLVRLIDKSFSREVKLKLAKLFPRLREKVESATLTKDIDWSSTKAFAFGARDEIWINLVGREPQGVIHKGEEYEKIRDLIIEKLTDSVDLKTDEKTVKKVYRREEIYHGDYLYKAPDLFVQWRQDFVISGLKNKGQTIPNTNLDDTTTKIPDQSGGHRENGIFLLMGPQIKEDFCTEGAEITDLAPTILYLSGQPIPEDMDGKILTRAIKDDYLTENPPRSQKMGTRAASTEEEKYSEKEAERIEKLLKDMGYID